MPANVTEILLSSPRVQINERVERIVLDVYEYGYLTTSFIHKLNFNHGSQLQAAQRKLKQLHAAGYLQRVLSPQSEAAYKIGPAGVQMVSLITGLEQAKLQAILARRDAESLPALLPHQIKVAGFHLAVTLALRDHPTASLTKWINWGDFEVNGKNLKRILQHSVYDARLKVYRQVLPDAAFILEGKGHFQGYSSLFYVECDNSTERISVVARKFVNYGLLYTSAHYTDLAAVKGFRVLFVTTGNKRIQAIRANLSGTYGIERVLFSTYDQITPESVFDAEIWCDVSGEPKRIIKKI